MRRRKSARGEFGEQHLQDFQDNEKSIPTISFFTISFFTCRWAE